MARLAGIGSRDVTNCGASGFHMLEHHMRRRRRQRGSWIHFLKHWTCWDRGLVWTEHLEKRDCSFPDGSDPYAASLSLRQSLPQAAMEGSAIPARLSPCQGSGPPLFSQLPLSPGCLSAPECRVWPAGASSPLSVPIGVTPARPLLP